MAFRGGGWAPACCNRSFASTTVSSRGARQREATSAGSFSGSVRRKAAMGPEGEGGEGRAKGGGRGGR